MDILSVCLLVQVKYIDALHKKLPCSEYAAGQNDSIRVAGSFPHRQGTDAWHMASAFTQHTVDTGAESFQNIKGNECLNRAGKTAAVDTVSAHALQIMLTQSQRHCHILAWPQAEKSKETGLITG